MFNIIAPVSARLRFHGKILMCCHALLSSAAYAAPELLPDDRRVDHGLSAQSPQKIIELDLISKRTGAPVRTPVFMDGKGPMNFVVDSGVWRSSVTRAAIHEFGISHKYVGRANVTGSGKTRVLRLLRIPSLRAGEIERRNSRVLELRSSLGSRQNPIHGLLGPDFYSSYIVYFNLQRNKLVLYPSTKEFDPDAFIRFDVIPMTYDKRRHAIYARVKINGHSMRALIDTGATTTMIDIKYKDRLGIDTSGTYQDTTVGVHGEKTHFLRAKVNSIQAGDKVWTSVGVGMREFSNRGENRFSAIIGMALLAKPEFLIDFKRGQVVILERRFKDLVR